MVGESRFKTKELLLLAGPLASVVAVQAGAASQMWPAEWVVPMGLAVLTFVWSPLFSSIPSLMMQDTRDMTLPDTPRMRRAAMLPFVLAARESPVRIPYLLSVSGFFVATVALIS